MSNLREAIFGADDSESEVVTVPQWGGLKIEVRSMTGSDRAAFMQSFQDDEGKVSWEALYPSLIITTAYDPESGERIFEVGDEAALNSKSAAALELLAGAAMRLSGMSEKAEEEAGKSS
jgi:hypothetical protein